MRKITQLSIVATLMTVLVSAISIGFAHQAHAEPPNPCFQLDLCGQ